MSHSEEQAELVTKLKEANHELKVHYAALWILREKHDLWAKDITSAINEAREKIDKKK